MTDRAGLGGWIKYVAQTFRGSSTPSTPADLMSFTDRIENDRRYKEVISKRTGQSVFFGRSPTDGNLQKDTGVGYVRHNYG